LLLLSDVWKTKLSSRVEVAFEEVALNVKSLQLLRPGELLDDLVCINFITDWLCTARDQDVCKRQ